MKHKKFYQISLMLSLIYLVPFLFVVVGFNQQYTQFICQHEVPYDILISLFGASMVTLTLSVLRLQLMAFGEDSDTEEQSQAIAEPSQTSTPLAEYQGGVSEHLQELFKEEKNEKFN